MLADIIQRLFRTEVFISAVLIQVPKAKNETKPNWTQSVRTE